MDQAAIDQQRAECVSAMCRLSMQHALTAERLRGLLSGEAFQHVDEHMRGAWEEIVKDARDAMKQHDDDDAEEQYLIQFHSFSTCGVLYLLFTADY